MRKPDTQILEGLFKEIEVTYYYNAKTELNVFFTRNGEVNEFISGWKLAEKQMKHLLDKGILK